MFGFGKKHSITLDTRHLSARVLFHKDVNDHVQHGVLCAEHKTLNVSKNDGVRFCFEGIEPPQLSATVLAYIFDQAERQGYKVHYMHSYANVAALIIPPVLRPRTKEPVPVLEDLPAGGGRGTARNVRRPSGERAVNA